MPAAQPETILLVEDDPGHARLIERNLHRAHITNEFVTLSDGQQAVDYLSGIGKFADRVQHPIPCLVLLDLKLPRKSGLEVLQWLRQTSKLPWMPVIVFSSSTQQEDIEKAYRSGASSFVVKPANVEKRIELPASSVRFW